MKRKLLSALMLALLTNISFAADTQHAPQTHVHKKQDFGVETQHIDGGVRPQDDFFRHLNGKWLKTVEIPADRSSWGSFSKLRDDTQPQLRTIIEAAAAEKKHVAGSDKQKIGDFYQSFMNEKKLEELGLKPLQADFAKVQAVKDKQEIAALIAHFNRTGVNAPFNFFIHQDNKDSTKYVVDVSQSGLNLPDREYYLDQKDQRMKQVREAYVQHIETMLQMAGDKDAKQKAQQIFALETELAKVQWSRVDLRDPVKAYNKVEVAKLGQLVPEFNWNLWLKDSGVQGKVDYLIVAQPSYMQGLGKLIESQPLDAWKAYMHWQVLKSHAHLLSAKFDQENFNFSGTVLSGAKEQRPRWKRAVAEVDSALGESVGKLYVAKYFPPERKAKMEALVKNLMLAYKQSIDGLDWMSDATKKEAQAKLAKFMPKIGYPNKWRDYSALKVKPDDLMGNVLRAYAHEYEYQLSKLGKPIDRDEWGMTPQTVNAYYNPELNEIVFPAAMLQPPFFNAKADDAVNYGAIGAVIGHEISHGFDDQGAQYDGDGNLRNWWSEQDGKNFATKTRALVEQYNAYSPLPGYNVNGELTLGENIADNSGLEIAFKAYKLSLGGKPAPVINGYTGEQRFFMGFGQVWRSKQRDQSVIAQIKTDPHSPAEFRANGTLKNHPGFYEAFGVKEGDKMYLPKDKRVTIW